MKLADLIKEDTTTNREELLSELSVTLGYTRPFQHLPTGITADQVIDWAIDAFKMHQESNGQASIFFRLQRMVNDAPKSDMLTEPIQDLEIFEDSALNTIPGFKQVLDAYRNMASLGETYKDTVSDVTKTFMLLNAINETALGKLMPGMKHENAQFKIGMAQAAMKHLGLKPKEL